MAQGLAPKKRAAVPQRRVFAFNGGFFWNSRVRRILQLAGHTSTFGWPQKGDEVLLWGKRPTTKRGLWVCQKTEARPVFVEDAVFRSLHPGRQGDKPMGLVIDHQAPYFDASTPSDLETLLNLAPLDDPVLLARAKNAMARIARHRLTKYAAVPFDAPLPAKEFVLVVDQTRGDAAVDFGGASEASFAKMLAQARADHPDTPILIKTHPETQAGLRPGYFGAADANENTHLFSDPVAPQTLFAAAKAVYVVTSQLGFEAILAGHKPQVFGQPFYAGWGLSTDHMPMTRRQRVLSAEQLFAGCVLKYPKWYDVYSDSLVPFEIFLDGLIAQTRAWRQDHQGWDGYEIRLWKRRPLQQFFGRSTPMRFDPDTPTPGHKPLVWGAKAGPTGAARLEDGFLRSKGLGAELVPPLSLILDDLGIYFDVSKESRLERILNTQSLTDNQRSRARRLRETILAAGVTKYNLGGRDLPRLPRGRRILVPGQVEDDASIRLGTQDISTNLGLLEEVRRQNPEAVILYKPHPDVEAGLRPGVVPKAANFADVVLSNTDPVAALRVADEVWTMTSLLGFEALLHGIPVTCLGLPFYAGWGLTQDRHPIRRRMARPDLDGLVYASLITYPRYFDPRTRLPCPPEVTVQRLAEPGRAQTGLGLRLLSKLQGVFAGQSHLWRR